MVGRQCFHTSGWTNLNQLPGVWVCAKCLQESPMVIEKRRLKREAKAAKKLRKSSKKKGKS